MNATERAIAGYLLDMPINSERQLYGNRVERFADGWRVNGEGCFSHSNAIKHLFASGDFVELSYFGHVLVGIGPKR